MVLVAVGIFHIVKRAPSKIVYDASFCLFSLSMFYFLGPELAEIRLCMSPILEFISKLYIGGLQIKLRLSTPSISQFIPCLSHYFEPSLELPLAPNCFWDASKGCLHPSLGPPVGPMLPCHPRLSAQQFTGEIPLLNAVSLGRRRNHLGTFG